MSVVGSGTSPKVNRLGHLIVLIVSRLHGLLLEFHFNDQYAIMKVDRKEPSPALLGMVLFLYPKSNRVQHLPKHCSLRYPDY